MVLLLDDRVELIMMMVENGLLLLVWVLYLVEVAEMVVHGGGHCGRSREFMLSRCQ